MLLAAAGLGAVLLAGCGGGGGNGAELSAPPAAAAVPGNLPAPVTPAAHEASADPAPDPGSVDLERQLAGPWYRLVPSPPDAAGAARGARLDLILFEPEQGRVTLFGGDVQESYLWDASRPLPGSRAAIRVRNELVHSLERTITVEVMTGAEIRVAMEDDDHPFAGDYRKFDDRASALLAPASTVQPGLVDLDLAGRYRDAAGQALEFAAPRFVWQNGDRQESGAYAVYTLGRPVIVFKIMSPAGVTRELRTYTVDYREQRRGERLLRSLVLRPARLEITGVTEISAAALHFEQSEMAEEATAAQPGAAPTPSS